VRRQDDRALRGGELLEELGADDLVREVFPVELVVRRFSDGPREVQQRAKGAQVIHEPGGARQDDREIADTARRAGAAKKKKKPVITQIRIGWR
jgi:hypothetical protein